MILLSGWPLDHGEVARGTRERAVPAGRSPAGLDRIRHGQ